MRKIYKYILDPAPQYGENIWATQIQESAYILDIQVQHDAVAIWAKVDPSQPMINRKFKVVPTGAELGTTPQSEYRHWATLQLNGGAFVLHVFEDLRPLNG